MPINSFDSYPLTWKPDRAALMPPYYKALAEDLAAQIRSGQLAPGTKLPPQREIADYLDLNYTTITRAYDLCKKQGLIYGSMGKGTFVAPHANEPVTLTPYGCDDCCIELGAINGFSEYSAPVEQVTRNVIEKGYLNSLFSYAFPEGHPHQLAAGVRWLEQLGVHTDTAHTIILSGGQNALTTALLSLFSPGDILAVDEFTYSHFIQLAQLLHLILLPVQSDAYGMLPEDLQKQCRTNRVRGIYLIPTCANPTTITMPPERRSALSEVIRKNHLTLIEDDVASCLYAAQGMVFPSFYDLLDGDSVYICGMTKGLCPGLRIAYMAFGERFRKAILHGALNINLKTSSFNAEVIAELILSGRAYEIAKGKSDMALRAAGLYRKYFPDPTDNLWPSYYKWLPIRSDKPAQQIERALQSAGVRVQHSDRFAVSPQNRRHYLRVALCSAGSTRNLEQGLHILHTFLTESDMLLSSI